MNLIKLITHF